MFLCNWRKNKLLPSGERKKLINFTVNSLTVHFTFFLTLIVIITDQAWLVLGGTTVSFILTIAIYYWYIAEHTEEPSLKLFTWK